MRLTVLHRILIYGASVPAYFGQLQPGAPWPARGHDSARTGCSPFGSSPTGWSFATGLSVKSSPAIDNDGTVFVGSADRNVYALNGSTGALIWSYMTGSVTISPVSLSIGGVTSSPAIGADGTVLGGPCQALPPLELKGPCLSGVTTLSYMRSAARRGYRSGPTPPGAQSRALLHWGVAWFSLAATTTKCMRSSA